MLSFLVPRAHAQVDISQEFGPAQDFNSVSSLVNVLLPNLFTIAGVVALIIVVVAGVKVIQHAGSGEGEKASKDKAAFTAAVVGLIMIAGAYFIVQIIGYVTGTSLLGS